MPVGKCPMCLDTKALVRSHLTPAALYQSCREPESEPIFVSPRIVMQTSRQWQDYLLCKPCEDVLNDGGENWLIPLLAEVESKFPLYDMITEREPDVVDGKDRLYAVASNPGICSDKITHFALGVFWKAAVHPWRGGESKPLIELGSYREPVRLFLKGEAEFPEHMALTVNVLPPPVHAYAFTLPFRIRTKGIHRFVFIVPGMQFSLGVGKMLPEEVKRSSFEPNPLHPILVSDTSDEIKSLFREMSTGAKRAKGVLEYMKKLPK